MRFATFKVKHPSFPQNLSIHQKSQGKKKEERDCLWFENLLGFKSISVDMAMKSSGLFLFPLKGLFFLSERLGSYLMSYLPFTLFIYPSLGIDAFTWIRNSTPQCMFGLRNKGNQRKRCYSHRALYSWFQSVQLNHKVTLIMILFTAIVKSPFLHRQI